MKRSLCISAFFFILLYGVPYAQEYMPGDTLYIVANSGLRLRTAPNSNAGTIRILDFGDPVYIVKTFVSDGTYVERSGWLDGQWAYVSTPASRYGGEHVSGYVYDAYLSSLEIPSHENELCLEPLNFSAPLQEYLAHHYPIRFDEQGREHSEDIDQCVTFFENGITMIRTVGRGWNKTDVRFQGYRLSEVVNLLRGMLVGDEMRQAFEDSLIFYKDKHGHINRIQAGYDVYPLHIEQHSDGTIEVSITDFPTG